MPFVLSRIFLFLTIPAFYLLFGWNNHVQAGKSAILGILALLALSSWTIRGGEESREGRLANVLVVFSFALIIAYHGFLREVFGVAQDDALVMEAIFNTNSNESYEFILQNFFALIKHVAVLTLFTGAFTLFTFRKVRQPLSHRFRFFRRNQLSVAISLTLIFLSIHLNPTMRKENPLLYFPLRYLKWEKSVEATRLIQDRLAKALDMDLSLAGMRSKAEGKHTVVFVLGESSTRLNWSLYGYPRNTTPELDLLHSQNQLLKFTDVVTTNGSTVLDMEQILTPATRLDPNRYQTTPDILTIARRAGYKTFWITNHSTDMTGSLSIFANHADDTINANRGGSRSEGSHDEVVLPYLQRALADSAPQKFIIVHLLNAHPAYYFRYPESFARFDGADDAVSTELKGAGRGILARKMRNQYDNAILYSDHILRQSIRLCEKYSDQSIAWLYAPDHGEDVAHYTDFVGHNNRVAAMFEIPMLLWSSPSFLSGRQWSPSVATRPYQTDQLDHTLLGLMKIEGNYYNASRDILSPEFVPLPRFVAGKVYNKIEVRSLALTR